MYTYTDIIFQTEKATNKFVQKRQRLCSDDYIHYDILKNNEKLKKRQISWFSKSFYTRLDCLIMLRDEYSYMTCNPSHRSGSVRMSNKANTFPRGFLILLYKLLGNQYKN